MRKKNIPLLTKIRSVSIFILLCFPVHPQNIASAYEPSTAGDTLIHINEVVSGILIDLRYAGTNNFVGKTLYDSNHCYLISSVAHRLKNVQHNLSKDGYGLKIWDCYRPLSVQKELWAIKPDSRYVADPQTGSRHNRGASIDLTLVDKNGHELPMPTGFDEFSEKAHRDYDDLPDFILENRLRLQTAMEKEGFVGLPTEWWHFDDPDWKKYPLRDEPLSSTDLEKPDQLLNPVFSIPSHVKKLVLVTADTWTSTTGNLSAFEKIGGKWEKSDLHWIVSLGKNGMAWGRGFENQYPGPLKSEGDLKTPAGIFSIGSAYGPKEATAKMKWPFTTIDKNWICVDDPKSRHYNEILNTKNVKNPDWSSFEHMRRDDHLYDYVINIEQNEKPTTVGKGSCLFFHVWRSKNAFTEGCTAMEKYQIEKLLNWLSPEDNPMSVFLIQPHYNDLKKDNRLP